MSSKKIALPAAGVGTLVAGGLVGRRLVSQWRANPDPLNGIPVAFPDGAHRVVTLDDGAAISTVTVGQGPPVVCVHGLTGSRNDWGPMAPALLRAGFQLIGIDQRGHGSSTPGSAGFGSAQLGRDLAHVLSVLDVQPLALVGHSMGGMAAMAYAVDHLEDLHSRVGHLVLIATAASLRTVRHSVSFRLGSIRVPDGLFPGDERLRVAAGISVFGARPSLHMVDEAIRSFRSCPEDVRRHATKDLIGHDVTGRLADLEVPTLVIGGSRDQLIPARLVRDLGSSIDGAELRMFTGAGHMVIWERHREIAKLIIDRLRQ